MDRPTSLPEEFPELLTVTEAAKLLRVSVSVMYRLKDSRALPVYRVSSSIRFKRSDLLDYLEKSCVPAVDRHKF